MSLEKLSGDEGESLLRSIGVVGNREELLTIVDAYQGHPLCLNLLGQMVSEEIQTSASALMQIGLNKLDEKGTGAVGRIISYYEEHLMVMN